MKALILFFALYGLLLVPARAQFNYSYNSTNDTATVTAYTGSGGAVIIPSTVTSGPTVYSVAAIGMNAFIFDTTITSITIPASVTSIGGEAFENCDGLTSITIPDSVTNIGDNAFDECPGITNFTVAADNPAYSSGNGVLFNSNQTTLIQYPAGSVGSSYAIPASVTYLGLNSFEGSSNLKTMTILGNVQNIGVGAFSNCPGLTNAIVGDGVTNLSDYAFYNCPVLTNLVFLGNAPPLGGSHVFEYLPAAATVYYLAGAGGWSSTYGGLPAVQLTAVNGLTFTITNNIATITGYTGTNGSVPIPSAIFGCPVTAISMGAFNFDTTITSFTIPGSVTNIGQSALAGCIHLTNITVTADNPDYSSLNGVLFNKNQTTLIEYSGNGGNYTVPGSVTNIGVVAFALYTNLTGITIPGSVITIGTAVCQQCPALTNVIIGNGVTSIGDAAFAACGDLTSVIFLGNAPALGGTNVFVTSDAPVTYVPATAYYLTGTSGWGSTYGGLPTEPLSTINNGFEFTLNNGGITITGYTGSSDDVTIPNAFYGYPVTAIAGNAFVNNANLTSVVIPDSVTNIGVEAFYNCAALTSVTLPDDITSIGVETFYNCASLTSITIPASVTKLGSGAFESCLSLVSATFLGNAPSLGNVVFGDDFATVYYYAGTTGWGSTYAGLPTVELAAPTPPQIRNGSAGIQSGNFGFTVTGATNQTFVIEASTNLTNWQPVWTNTLSGTNTVFTDLQWTNYNTRFYRAR